MDSDDIIRIKISDKEKEELIDFYYHLLDLKKEIEKKYKNS